MPFKTDTGNATFLSFPAIDTSKGNGAWYLLTPITPIKQNPIKNIAGYMDGSNVLHGDYMRRSNLFQMIVDNLVIEDFSYGTALTNERESSSSPQTTITNIEEWFSNIDNFAECDLINIQGKMYYMDHTRVQKDGKTKITRTEEASMNTYGFLPTEVCLPSAAWQELDLTVLDASYTETTLQANEAHNRAFYKEFTNGLHGYASHPDRSQSSIQLCPPTGLQVLTGPDAAQRVFGDDTPITSFDSRVVIDFVDNNPPPNTYLNVRVDLGKSYWVFFRKLEAYSSNLGRLHKP